MLLPVFAAVLLAGQTHWDRPIFAKAGAIACESAEAASSAFNARYRLGYYNPNISDPPFVNLGSLDCFQLDKLTDMVRARLLRGAA